MTTVVYSYMMRAVSNKGQFCSQSCNNNSFSFSQALKVSDMSV